MVLVGHAFGAYLAAVYAIKHPTSVTQLVFSSPVGLEKYNRYLVSILSMIAIPSTAVAALKHPQQQFGNPLSTSNPPLLSPSTPFHAHLLILFPLNLKHASWFTPSWREEGER